MFPFFCLIPDLLKNMHWIFNQVINVCDPAFHVITQSYFQPTQFQIQPLNSHAHEDIWSNRFIRLRRQERWRYEIKSFQAKEKKRKCLIKRRRMHLGCKWMYTVICAIKWLNLWTSGNVIVWSLNILWHDSKSPFRNPVGVLILTANACRNLSYTSALYRMTSLYLYAIRIANSKIHYG
jgi:hypothetical protein